MDGGEQPLSGAGRGDFECRRNLQQLEAAIWSAGRCYEKFMCMELRGVSYFYALEANPGRDGYHAHALWADCKKLR